MEFIKRIPLYLQHPVAIGAIFYGIPLAFLCTLFVYMLNRISQKQDPACNRIEAQEFNQRFYHHRLKYMVLAQVVITALYIGLTSWVRFKQLNWDISFRILATHYNLQQLIRTPPSILWQFLLGAGIMFFIAVVRTQNDGTATSSFPSWKKYAKASVRSTTVTGTSGNATPHSNATSQQTESSLLNDLQKALARENAVPAKTQGTETVDVPSPSNTESLDTNASEEDQVATIKKEWASRFNINAENYFEVPNNGTDAIARCSDRSCPCPETACPRGEGYIYISQNCAAYRKDARSAVDAAQKIRTVGGYETQEDITAIFMCEEGAKLRGLNLEVAQKDARLWWYTGWLPLRATPKA